MKHYVLLTAALLAVPAAATEYTQFSAPQSRLGFVSRQMNVPVDGSFKRFSSRLKFDPAKPADGSAEIEIDIASVDTGSQEADDEVAGKSWFHTKAFPTARFVSSSVKPLGGNRYEVAGTMTIKGHSRDVVAPFTFKEQGELGVFEGGFTLKRADYALGEGMWAAFDTVANEIQINFRLAAAAAK